MKIGVLGGTFDPVHKGHLSIAAEARGRLDLDEVLFVPAGQPWQKSDRRITPPEHRLQMLRLAISGCAYCRLSPIEVDCPGLSFTVDTIAGLKEQLGGAAELYFILGWDSLVRLHQWKEPARLIKMCRLVAVPRPGHPPPDVSALEAAIPGIAQRLILLDKPEVPISATEVRERVARGLPIRPLVPEAVAEYIEKKKLYLNQGGAS